jgi:hypothetical protein
MTKATASAIRLKLPKINQEASRLHEAYKESVYRESGDL